MFRTKIKKIKWTFSLTDLDFWGILLIASLCFNCLITLKLKMNSKFVNSSPHDYAYVLQKVSSLLTIKHCVKSARIRSYCGPCFPVFELITETYSVSLRIHCKCWKIRTRITPNTDIFYAVKTLLLLSFFLEKTFIFL